jgi:SNF2-related domain
MGRILVYKIDDGPRWAITSSYYSPALTEHAKAVPGTVFDRPTLSWQGYPDAIRAVAARLKSIKINVEDVADLPEPEGWRTARSPFLFATAGLRDYQVEGVRFLIARSREGAILADGMRLGKSCQAIVAARAFKDKTVVVCPSHIVGVWARPKDAPEGSGEIAKWWPEAWKSVDPEKPDAPGVIRLSSIKPAKLEKQIVELEKKQRKGLSSEETKALTVLQEEYDGFVAQLSACQVIICHYDIIYAWTNVLKLWGVRTLILDEAHILSSWRSQRSNALKELAQATMRRLLLTGTPVTNTPRNLHNLLDIMADNRFGFFFTDAEDEKGNLKRPGTYARLFCDSHLETVGERLDQKTFWVHTGRSNIDEPDGKWALTKEETLKERLRYVMLRRLKKDVDKELPPMTRQIIDVEIPARAAVTPSMKMLGPGGKELRRALDLAADGKLKFVVDLIVNHIEEGEKVLCFCYRRLFAERVAEMVAKRVNDDAHIVFAHGGQTPKERDKRIHSLRTHKGPGLMAGTIDTTSSGIDLSFAGLSIVAELTFEWHDLAQLEERLYKFGSSAKMLIQYVIARGTGDELILRAVISKIDTSERMIGEQGSRMREELSAQNRGNAMDRLAKALQAMQAASSAPKKKKPLKASKTSREKGAKQ